MILSKRYLLDVNVLVALASDEHEHHRPAHHWFDRLTKSDEWAACPLTEAGYMRLAANPAIGLGPGNLKRAAEVLAEMQKLPGYCYWPITESWTTLAAPFAARIFGHQQVTDAYLLGVAIKQHGVLITFDRGLRYMAGPQFAQHVHVIE
jgi:hypothetical protein